MNTRLTRILALALPLLAAAPVVAQEAPRRSWTLAGGVGAYRVDDLAGTPVVPVVQLTRDVGSRAIVALSGALINNAGFYSLTALTLDLGVGIRSRPGRVEAAALVGPSTILGGDSDGTPYLGLAAHGAGQLTFWASERVGFTAGATGRVWLTTGNSRFSPGAFGGIRIRL